MSTTTKPLDVAEVRALLVRAVEEKGADYIYTNPDGVENADGMADCVNWDPQGNPSCIAGHVFVWAGIQPNPDLEGETVFTVNKALGILDSDAERGLTRAQTAQDAGRTWGEALTAFDEAVEL